MFINTCFKYDQLKKNILLLVYFKVANSFFDYAAVWTKGHQQRLGMSSQLNGKKFPTIS